MFVGILQFYRIRATRGAIENASVATDRDTGRSRGFGFVSMPNDAEAESAMAALNGKESGGRALTVNEARAAGASQRLRWRTWQ